MFKRIESKAMMKWVKYIKFDFYHQTIATYSLQTDLHFFLLKGFYVRPRCVLIIINIIRYKYHHFS